MRINKNSDIHYEEDDDEIAIPSDKLPELSGWSRRGRGDERRKTTGLIENLRV